MNKQEQMVSVAKNEDREIIVTHVTIRLSISVLVLRLILIEVIAASGVILLHSLVISTSIFNMAQNINDNLTVFNTPLFLTIVSLKTFLMIFIIIQWVNEYYEITSKEIIHRRGLIFKKEERYTLDHVGSVEIEQGIIGKIFNFGTIKLFNWAVEKYTSLYLIHNPIKYESILKKLLPEADKGKQVIKEHLIDPEEI